MLRVPRIRQPDLVSCLPACVWSVLRYQGHAVEYEEVEAACRVAELGTLDYIAAQGLQEAGWDVEMVDEFDLEQLREAVREDRPLIAVIGIGKVGIHAFAHAVVICDVQESELIVRDPIPGEYVSLSVAEAELIAASDFSGFFIAGKSA